MGEASRLTLPGQAAPHLDGHSQGSGEGLQLKISLIAGYASGFRVGCLTEHMALPKQVFVDLPLPLRQTHTSLVYGGGVRKDQSDYVGPAPTKSSPLDSDLPAESMLQAPPLESYCCPGEVGSLPGPPSMKPHKQHSFIFFFPFKIKR